MFIKSINISGFRSYRDKACVSDISRQFNVVVGQNGSGKSNFFAAIQFVLSDEFCHLTAEDRQNLLHEGTGNKTTIAIVELVFDNSDRRLAAFEGNEFTISRQISARKDQYMIDGRMVTRSEIVNLMESAGFSRSNPYHIVKQGKIAELATATDLARLKLLREVAGTRIYDEKKSECLELLSETQERIEKCNTLLGYMDARLETLESEKEELKEYQKYDRIRRVLEFTILTTEIRDCKKEFDNVEKRRQDIQTSLNEEERNKDELGRQISSLENDLRRFEVRLNCIVEELTSTREEEAKLEEACGMCTLNNRDLQEQVETERRTKEQAEDKLNEVNEAIEQTNKELDEIKPLYNQLSEEQARIIGDLNIFERRRNEFYARGGVECPYKTAEERDRSLKKKILGVNNHVDDQQTQIKRIENTYEEENASRLKILERISEIEVTIMDNQCKMDNLSTNDDQLQLDAEAAGNRAFHTATERKNVSDRLSEIDAQLDHLNQNFMQMIPRSTADGIRSMNMILDDLKEKNHNGKYDEIINGYHGIAVKLMKTEPIYFKAVEITAGSALSHHVVENERIAMALLKEMNNRSCRGEATFFALNRVNAPESRTLRDKGGRQLISVIEFPEKFTPVFRQMFGGTILVKDIATGRRIARNEQFNCVTFDGDEINFSGPMSGGFMDSRKSRLEIMSHILVLEPQQRQLKEQVDRMSAVLGQQETEAVSLRAKLSDNEQTRLSVQRDHERLLAEKRSLVELETRVKMAIEDGRSNLIVIKRKLRELEAHKEQLEKQIGTPLSSQITAEEAAEIEELDASIKAHRKKAEEIMNKTSSVFQKKARLENKLSACLLRQREDLKMKVNGINLEVKRHELKSKSLEENKLRKRINELSSENDKLMDECTLVRKQIFDARNNIEQLTDAKSTADMNVSNYAADIELLRRRMIECDKRREDARRKMKELGPLPVDVTTRYGNKRKKELEAEWMECLQFMKKYTNVNKKALDHYVRSTAERDELQTKLKESQKDYDNIQALIQSSESRKFDALHLTFKQVAKNFHDIFKKLVPIGTADLVMKTAPVDQNDPEAVEKADQMHIMERFIGVGIRVNFSSDSSEGCRELYHLSGGQKTLVALALIFAIQKCDPAPFYLFDEVDAALDQEKRHAVAKLIDEFSLNAQFIATTFRPEMLAYASRCYGVRFRNKVSYISPVGANDAYQFLSNEVEPEDEEMQS